MSSTIASFVNKHQLGPESVDRPLVSIVTPFHNAAAWLSDCIRSVLGQTYRNWEYILLDNCSTDGSSDIARQYAETDARIRFVRNNELLSQIRNYNTALSLISGESRYCKIVQADDWIFPQCIGSMVDVFESAESIGLVSSYYLKGALVRGYGLPYPSPFVPGQELVRLLLRTGLWVFGSPSAVMYRSSIVRAQRPFYDESCLHEDTEACIRILQDWDFGFVHQVLSFLRTDNESISSRVRAFQPDILDGYIVVRRYAPVFLPPSEAASLRGYVKHHYYGFLAKALLEARPPAFWRYHADGLRTIGEDLDWPFLSYRLAKTLCRYAVNPGWTISIAFRQIKAGLTKGWRLFSAYVTSRGHAARRKSSLGGQAS
jgi:glycosyltransferase involved in cell wall biosynthesis